MYYVYRYMFGDQWIYVGKADASHTRDELRQRIYAHSKDERFQKYEDLKISFCVFKTRSDMNAVETMLIKIKHPIINIVDKTQFELPFIFDDKNIDWIPIEEYGKIHIKDNTLPSIIDDKLFSFIKEKFIKSEPLFFDEYYSCNCKCDLSSKLFACMKSYFESNVDLCFPMCRSMFSATIDEIAKCCEYNKIVKPQTFSRLVKESLRRICKRYDKSNEWWAIDCRRRGDVINFQVSHYEISVRNFYNSIASLLRDPPVYIQKN